MPQYIDTELLDQIAAFLARTGMSPTMFGNKAASDPRLIPDLKEGRELRRQLRERVLKFIADNTPDDEPLKKMTRQQLPVVSKTLNARSKKSSKGLASNEAQGIA